MRIDLDGRRVLITGGNSGLGEAMSLAFAACGARTAINHVTRPEEAGALARRIEAAGGIAITLEGDVSDPASVEAMFARMDDQWGGIDILVNNAGVDGDRALSWESDVDAWSRGVDINLKGAYLCARQALRRMVAQRSGVVLNISSVHERIAWSGYSAYTASKAGLSMMARTMAQEAAPHGVRVLCLAPGAIRTPINAAVWSDPEGLQDLLTKIPLGRVGQPEDIAAMAVMLASDHAGYVTGTTVFVDGGMTDYPAFAHGG